MRAVIEFMDTVIIPMATEGGTGKLRSRAVSTAWWRSIGSPKHVCAPMVDQSELAFRELSRRYGAGLCYTPMLHAGLAAGDSGIQYLERQFTTRRGDWPLSAQFAGHDASVVCKAAERTLALAGDNVDNIVALDLNLGCPQQIARRGRYGAWLWERDADAAVDVIRALRTHFATDERVVTAKVRILPPGDDKAVAETADRCLRLADAGRALMVVRVLLLKSMMPSSMGSCGAEPLPSRSGSNSAVA